MAARRNEGLPELLQPIAEVAGTADDAAAADAAGAPATAALEEAVATPRRPCRRAVPRRPQRPLGRAAPARRRPGHRGRGPRRRRSASSRDPGRPGRRWSARDEPRPPRRGRPAAPAQLPGDVERPRRRVPLQPRPPGSRPPRRPRRRAGAASPSTARSTACSPAACGASSRWACCSSASSGSPSPARTCPSDLLYVLLIENGHAWLRDVFAAAGAPAVVTGLLVDGVYLATAWVVSGDAAADGDLLPAVHAARGLRLPAARGVQPRPPLRARPARTASRR